MFWVVSILVLIIGCMIVMYYVAAEKYINYLEDVLKANNIEIPEGRNGFERRQ